MFQICTDQILKLPPYVVVLLQNTKFALLMIEKKEEI